MTTTTAHETVQPVPPAQPVELEASRGTRLAAAAGMAFVVCNVVAAFLPGTPPASDASAAKIATYFTDHDGAIKAQLLLAGLGIAALLWWFGALWRVLSDAEGARPRLATAAAVSLATGLTLGLVSGTITSTAAFRVDDVRTTHMLYTFSFVVISAAGFGVGVFLLATSAVTYRAGIGPRWISYLGWLAAAAFLAGVAATVTDAGAVTALGLIAFLVWCAWIVAISAVMWRSATR